jgi:hypothetical protein
MQEFARVVNQNGLIRDLKSNAILSDDRAAFEARKKQLREEADKNSLLKRIDALEARLQQLEERLNNER